MNPSPSHAPCPASALAAGRSARRRLSFSCGPIRWRAKGTTTSDDIFSFGGDEQSERQVLSLGQLLARVTALMQSCEGCGNVGVVGVTPLDRPDAAGCNWSYTLELDAAGVPAGSMGSPTRR
jgi:hypothetical protein